MEPMPVKDPSLIMEQIETVARMYRSELPNLVMNPDVTPHHFRSRAIRTVFAIGDGDSYYAALAAEYLWKEVTHSSFFAVPAFEFLEYVLPLLGRYPPNSVVVIGISASGSSAMVIEALGRIRDDHPDILTVGVSGSRGSALESAGRLCESVALEECGRSPGIRTYAASLVGLFSLACSIGTDRRARIARSLAESGAGAVRTCDAVLQAAEPLLSGFSGALLTCLGSGPAYATALFGSAKIVEAAGVSALGQDLAEWNHVERFAYPLESQLWVLVNPGSAYRQAVSILKPARELGHHVVAIAPDGAHDLDDRADIVLPIHGPYHEPLSPLTHYLPLTVYAYCLAKHHGRAMFMTDRNATGVLN